MRLRAKVGAIFPLRRARLNGRRPMGRKIFSPLFFSVGPRSRRIKDGPIISPREDGRDGRDGGGRRPFADRVSLLLRRNRTTFGRAAARRAEDDSRRRGAARAPLTPPKIVRGAGQP